MPEGPTTSGDAAGRKDSRLEKRIARTVASRRVFPFLALATLSLALFAGFVATLVDKEDFPSFGDGAWWALVTIATVGYGDVVPTTPWGGSSGAQRSSWA